MTSLHLPSVRVGLGITAACAVLLLALPGGAGAAVQLGQVAPTDPAGVGTGNALQYETASLNHTVPFPGGVITGWSHRGKNGSAGSGRLQLWREIDMNTFGLVGRSELRTFTPGAVTFFPTRIKVTGGELLGLRTVGAGAIYAGGSGDVSVGLSGGDLAPNQTATVVGAAAFILLNVSALLEPDGDNDSYGDETQDKCAGLAGPLNGCPNVTLSLSAKKQKLKKKLLLFARASADSTLVVQGSAVKRTTAKLAAGKKTKVKVALKAKARKALAKKLRKKGKGKVKVKATTTGPGGIRASDRVLLNLKR